LEASISSESMTDFAARRLTDFAPDWGLGIWPRNRPAFWACRMMNSLNRGSASGLSGMGGTVEWNAGGAKRIWHGGPAGFVTRSRRTRMTDSATSANNPPPGIGLFDLDGTLIAWDCQLLFRHFVVRREPWRMVFLPVFLVFVPLAGWLGAAVMKRIFLSYLWRVSPETLAEYAREFADSVMPAVYPKLRAEIERHRAAGHFLVLASASPEFYVREIGRKLGFDLTLGTPVEFGPFFPDLVNHKGEAKVKRLRDVLPASFFETANSATATATPTAMRICRCCASAIP
jgi:HAD superfamily phosphoserine phosphatase-like hydrolase